MNMTIEELLETPYWVIDPLPEQVPADSPGQYFAVEEYFLAVERLAALKEKHIRIVLKLNCYRDLHIDEEETPNPPPERIAEAMRRRYVCLRFGDSLLVSQPDDPGMTLYHPDEKLLALTERLAAAEGLFVWQPPKM